MAAIANTFPGSAVSSVVATDTDTDAALVERTLAGDSTAFETLVRRHYRSAYAVALAHTANRAEAEDVCHDTFLRVAQRLAECRDPARFVHWLCAIARNRARNAIARQSVRKAEPLTEESASSPHDPGRELELRELGARLESALATLSAVQREVVLLHDLDGWTHEDIAQLIGTSAGLSRQHLFNARRRLRVALGQHTSKEYFNE